MFRLTFTTTLLLLTGTGAFLIPLRADDLRPSPAVGRTPAVEPSYRIGQGDVLSVYIWHEPDASSASVKVRADGIVTLRLVGEVPVAGLTLREVQSELVKRYATFLRDPAITINIEETNSQVVYVVGEVKKSGSIHFAGPITVLQALAEAGGFSDFAKRGRIYVLRQVIGGATTLPFDYDAVVKGRKPEQNIVLQRGDTIVVPR